MTDTRHDEQPLFTVANHHFALSGTPPHITDQTEGYKAYWVGPYGDQFVFRYHREASQGTLYCGDWNWERPATVMNAAVHRVLNEQERQWLAVCWAAAASEKLAEVTARQQREIQAYEQRVHQAMTEVARDLGVLASRANLYRELANRVGEENEEWPEPQSRPELERALVDTLSGKVDVLLMAAWDRLSRDPIERAVICCLLERAGKRAVSVEDEE